MSDQSQLFAEEWGTENQNLGIVPILIKSRVTDVVALECTFVLGIPENLENLAFLVV